MEYRQQVYDFAEKYIDYFLDIRTTKEDLEEAGFIETVQGKGCFVAAGNQGLLREEELRRMEALLAQAAALAETLGVTRADLHKALDLVAPETRE